MRQRTRNGPCRGVSGRFLLRMPHKTTDGRSNLPWQTFLSFWRHPYSAVVRKSPGEKKGERKRMENGKKREEDRAAVLRVDEAFAMGCGPSMTIVAHFFFEGDRYSYRDKTWQGSVVRGWFLWLADVSCTPCGRTVNLLYTTKHECVVQRRPFLACRQKRPSQTVERGGGIRHRERRWTGCQWLDVCVGHGHGVFVLIPGPSSGRQRGPRTASTLLVQAGLRTRDRTLVWLREKKRQLEMHSHMAKTRRGAIH